VPEPSESLRPTAVPGYLGMFVSLGVAMSVIGPALPYLRDRAGIEIGPSGWLLAAQSTGYIAGSFLSGRRYDRGRVHHVIVGAACAGVAAMWGVVAVGSMPGLLVLFAALGAAAGTVDVGGNTLVVWSEPPERTTSTLNALHLCFGIGALSTPVVVDLSVERFDSLVLPAVLLSAVVGVASAMVVRGRVPRPRPPSLTGSSTHHGRRILVLAGAFLFLYVGLEAGFAGWAATFAEEIRLGGGTSLGGELTSVFFVGFTLSRVAAIPLARRVPAATLLLTACASSLVAIAGLAVFHDHDAAVWAFTGLFGVALGPQYATLIAYGDERLHFSGRDTSLIVAASGVGGLLLPLSFGWLLDGIGASALPWAATVTNVLTLTVAAAVIVAARRLDDHADGLAVEAALSDRP
jgi:fucose permease